MEKQDKDFWDNVRDTVRQGIREMRTVGDEMARQGRLRMDIYQAERRLKNTYGALGEAAYGHLVENSPVPTDDARVAELTARIRYYQEELSRLREELQRSPESA